MIIDYEVTADDLLAFNEYYLTHSAVYRRQWIRGLVISVLVLSLLPILVLVRRDKPFMEAAVDIWPLLLGPIIMVPIYFAISKRGLRRNLRRFIVTKEVAGALGPHSLMLQEDGLSSRDPTGEQRVKWSAVQSVTLTEDRLMIFLNNATGFVIPRRAFADRQQLEAFVAEVRQKAGITL
ncbi:YcxB family protein [Planctomicrobium piriforme]|uniref:PH domain-containing protein n=1 Tax=Planctomicrobium piriforme TaxID=1576369 RepID=A0A1I3KQU4_9PLAN|nr:YcxB family protein [Planctomicrobium piriforme]SFI74754.1 PH domain-containing protein [Planctomicrobium piriforme]